MPTKKKTHTFTVTRPTDVKITLPAYYDEVSECTYVFHEGRIMYQVDGLDTVEELTNTLNYSLSQRTDEEKLRYIKGLAQMIEATLKPKRRTPVKKKAVTRKKK